MYQREVQAYERHQHLKNAATELGISFQTLYWRLKQSGVSVSGNKERYGSITDKLAVKGEAIFQSLVPHAEDQNKLYFQPKIDFLVGKTKVEIKTAKRTNYSDYQRWSFCLKKQKKIADWFVCFGLDSDAADVELCLLIPDGMLRDNLKTISVTAKGKSKWHGFEVSTDELANFFASEKF